METVFNRLAGTRINAQMMEQEDLTKAFMALLHHIVDGCNNRGIGLEAVSFSAPEVSGNSIKAKVVFGHGGRTTVSAGNISGDISKFFLQKNARCARALEKNPRIEEFWCKVLTCVKNYATYKHGSLKFVKVKKATITPDNVLKVELQA